MKQLIVCLILLFQVNFVFCQADTILYYAGNNKPSDEASAFEKDVVNKINQTKFKIKRYLNENGRWLEVSKEIIYILNDTTLKIELYHNETKISETIRNVIFDPAKSNYIFQDFYENGNIKIEGRTLYKFPLFLTDTIKEYYENGILKQKSFYDNNQTISNEIWNKDGTKYMDNVFSSADELPLFPGGIVDLRKAIANSVVYPAEARRREIQGRVYVGFVIMEDGYIDGITVVKSVDPILDEAAIEAVKSFEYKWEPAKINGKNVRFFYTVPINFSLI